MKNIKLRLLTALLACVALQQPCAAETDEERDLQELRNMGITPGMILDAVREEVREKYDNTTGSQPGRPSSWLSSNNDRYWPQTPGINQTPDAYAQGRTSTLVINSPQTVTITDFQQSLSPYGRWINVDGYGNVWQPYVTVFNAQWRPYCQGGKWLWTNKGWYWQSFYTWGWAPFHYGRWAYARHRRWVWIPDVTWAPAWVQWRSSDEYLGWAPLPPAAQYDLDFGFRYSNYGSSWSFDFGLSESDYTYVPATSFMEANLFSVTVPRERHHDIHSRSSIIPHCYETRHHEVVNSGPPPEQVRKDSRFDKDAIRIVKRNTSNTSVIDRNPDPATQPATPVVYSSRSTVNRSANTINIVKKITAPSVAPATTPAPAPQPAATAAPAKTKTSAPSSTGGRSSRALSIFKSL